MTAAHIHLGPTLAREDHLRDQRDAARAWAVDFEGRIAKALQLHANQEYCAAHGFPDHNCLGARVYRCYECAKTYNGQPCRTRRALEGLL